MLYQTILPVFVILRVESKMDGLQKVKVPKGNFTSMVGSTASLPCNLTSPVISDEVRLVLWFKDNITKPVYTFDKRNLEANHWSDDNIFGGRVFFEHESNSFGYLAIENIQPYDEGLYKCRVDFKVHPTSFSDSTLSVKAPPEKPKIYDNLNKSVQRMLGPYKIGQTIKVKCVVLGGRPTPNVTWWRDGHQIADQRSEIQTEKDIFKVTNTLFLYSLTKADVNSILTCLASNDPNTVPVSSSVKLDMIFGPSSVEIRKDKVRRPLTENKEICVTCEAKDAHPPPNIEWKIGDKDVSVISEKLETTDNVYSILSTICFIPTKSMNNKNLTCKASAKGYLESGLEDSAVMDIQYITRAKLLFGAKMNLQKEQFKRGDDVYLDCEVESNPQTHEIVWLKDGKVISQNIKNGIIISNLSLVLQQVTRHSSGHYTCTANNNIGSVTSNNLALYVQSEPECITDQKKVYRVPLHAVVNIDCQVQSEEGQDLQFRWLFNNSKEILDIQQSQTKSDSTGQWSIVDYIPRTEHDYGTLLCYGQNLVGWQKKPCMFELLPITGPDRVSNCSVATNQLVCQPGQSHGGSNQTFQLIASYLLSGEIIAKITSNDKPVFDLNILDVVTGELNLTVISVNSLGYSEPFSLNHNITISKRSLTLSVVESSHLHENQQHKYSFVITPILAVLIAVGAILILMTIIITIFIFICSKKTKHETLIENTAKLNIKKVDQNIGNQCCPDIIPLDKGYTDKNNETNQLSYSHTMDTHFPHLWKYQHTNHTCQHPSTTPLIYQPEPVRRTLHFSSPGHEQPVINQNVPYKYSTLQGRTYLEKKYQQSENKYHSLKQPSIKNSNYSPVIIPVVPPPPLKSDKQNSEICMGEAENRPLLSGPNSYMQFQTSPISDKLNTSSNTILSVSDSGRESCKSHISNISSDRESQV